MALPKPLQWFAGIVMGTPAVSREERREILPATLMTAAYQATEVLDVRDARKITIIVDGDAAEAGNQLTMIPLLNYQPAGYDAVPSATADQWFIPCVTDGSVTPAVVGGTLLAGADFTIADAFGQVTMLPIEIRSPTAAGAATAEWRFSFEVDVTAASWFHLQVADVDAGTKSTVQIWAVRSV